MGFVMWCEALIKKLLWSIAIFASLTPEFTSVTSPAFFGMQPAEIDRQKNINIKIYFSFGEYS